MMSNLDRILLLILLLSASFLTLASGKPYDSSFFARKTIVAGRFDSAPKIDGIPDESFWKTLPVADNFVQYSPKNGSKPYFRTEVRFGYDNDALFISAIMYDPFPDSICKEMGRRDQVEILNTDYISFDILPYNDRQNMYEFKVTPAGLQNDAKYSAVGQDVSWDAVWESAARITDSGWMAEARIPYSALRFPKAEVQVWGINIWRNLRRKNEWSTWSFVDNKVQDIFKYYGELTGIEKISPPLRLSVTPYVSGYLQRDPHSQGWANILRGGMDLKWGINQSYTVDMMLIPDFGQVESDDRILNLTPFEIRYDEKRQFFTEATEMFDKCGIFYSRRVGASPRKYLYPSNNLFPNEVILTNPEETRILNATKISGRNAKGLGLGLFNAITSNTWAEVQDTVTGQVRSISTQPFTNYNVTVLDKNLENNSYLTFINTNYCSPADKYTANVTGMETRISNKASTVAAFARINVSNQFHNTGETFTGHSMQVALSRPSGKFQFELEHDHADKVYNPNDMGFLNNNNYMSNSLSLWYSILQPRGHIINAITRFTTVYNTLYEDFKFKSLTFEGANKITYRNFWQTHIVLDANPLGLRDYYEPRLWGMYYRMPAFYSLEGVAATDSRKPFLLKASFSGMLMPDNAAFLKGFQLTPRMRFSNRFNLAVTFSWSEAVNDYGWVKTSYDTTLGQRVLFGRREVTTFSSVLSGRYVFSARTSVTLRMRHYWSAVEYDGYYTLEADGKLTPSHYSGEHNINFNAFTADAQFVWYFAPGSELSLVWKSTVNDYAHSAMLNYFENLEHTFTIAQTNSFSLRLLYYLDYQHLKKIAVRN